MMAGSNQTRRRAGSQSSASATVTSLQTALAPILVRKQDANLTLAVGAAYVDIDTSGTAASRTLDVVIPGVSAGQWISINPNILVTSSTIACYLDAFTIVAGAPVHKFGDPTSLTGPAPSSWTCNANLIGIISNPVFYQVVAGDIEGGSVRVRFRSLQTSGAARVVFSGGGGLLILEGRGPFG